MGKIMDLAEKNNWLRSFPAGDMDLAGQSHALASLTKDESELIIEKLDTSFADETNPLLSRIVAEGIPDIIRTIQSVKEETKVEFQGLLAQGNALDINLLRPGDITRLNGSVTPTDWLESYPVRGKVDWLGTPLNPEVMTQNQGMIFLGLIDSLSVPKISAFQFFRFGNAPGPPQSLGMGLREKLGDGQTPTYQFSRPIIMLPEAHYNATILVQESGDSRLQPIGFIVSRRADIADLIV